jgi:hypothetical protein
MRPGCDQDAAARLTYDPVGCEVWLDDLAERVGRHQEICALHAERLTVPRGWLLSDRRSDQPPMFIAPVAPVAPAPTEEPRRRRRATSKGHPATQTLELFEVLRQELAEADAVVRPVVAATEPDPEPEREPDPEPEPVGHSPEPDELPEVLQATSPLLARAFGATGHQRSVLTQRGPAGPAETARDEE